MSFPCVCFRCEKCINLESLRNPECLSIEAINCSNLDCDTCDFDCNEFTELQDSDQRLAVSC